MSWSPEQIMQAIASPAPKGGDASSVSLPLFEVGARIGVGVDGQGWCTLVLPGQIAQVAFETSVLKFDPWCDTKWIEGDKALSETAVLRCKFDRDDESLKHLVASVLISLVDLQQRFGDAGKAIWALRELFGNGFHAAPDKAVLRGLLGELLCIRASGDAALALRAWHVGPDDRYDFSAGSTRVEVKTTTSSVREHRFTSRQLPPLHGVHVWIASVQLAEVSDGASIASIFAELAEKLPNDLAKKLSDVIIETAKLPPAALSVPMIDLDTSVNSIRLFLGEDIATPGLVPGASDLRWTAFLEENAAQPPLLIAALLKADD
jgi:hypothetical protein